MKRSKIPPLGVIPRFVVDEDRIRELEAGIGRFLEAKWPIPIVVVNEYNELVDKLETEDKKREEFASMKKPSDKIEQNPWSEEDERHLCGLIGLLEDVSKDKRRDFRIISDNEKDDIEHWLKSIKDRVQHQPQWMPSDEQMETLKYACGGNYVNLGILESLYQELKKLKG